MCEEERNGAKEKERSEVSGYVQQFEHEEDIIDLLEEPVTGGNEGAMAATRQKHIERVRCGGSEVERTRRDLLTQSQFDDDDDKELCGDDEHKVEIRPRHLMDFTQKTRQGQGYHWVKEDSKEAIKGTGT